MPEDMATPERRIPTSVHTNSQLFGVKCGIATYAEAITSRLYKYSDIDVDALYFSQSPQERSVNFPLRRIDFPEHFMFNDRYWINYGSLKTFITKLLHKLFGHSPSYNELIADDSSDVSLFFDNRVPYIDIHGKIIAVLHDIKPLRVNCRMIIMNWINQHIVRKNTIDLLAKASSHHRIRVLTQGHSRIFRNRPRKDSCGL